MTSFKDQTSNREVVAPSTWEKLKSNATDLKMWLFFATALLALWHGILDDRLITKRDIFITAIFWLATLFFLWKKRDTLTFTPQTSSTVVGFLILGWVFFRGLSIFWFESLLVQLIPFIVFFAFALIASGWRNLSQYNRFFFALFTFSAVEAVLKRVLMSEPNATNVSKLTAEISAFLLHYLGFDVYRDGIFIELPKGAVEVYYGCTGGNLITLVLPLTLVLAVMARLNFGAAFKVIASIVVTAFLIGVFRVAFLATVVSNRELFDYWHGDAGNQIFSLITFGLWMVAANFIYEYYEKNSGQETSTSDQETTEESEEDEESLPPLEPITTVSKAERRSWLFPIASVAMALVTVITLVFPQVGRRENRVLAFPSQLSLENWEQTESASLVENPETELQFNGLHAGQQYQYQQSNQDVTVALRFISPTHGSINAFLENIYDESRLEAYKAGKTRSLSDVGSYQLFRDGEKAYLSACLVPDGKSTATRNQYAQQSDANVFDIKTLIPRLVGLRSLRERRCLWVHLSTPLEGESPEAKEDVLEAVFQEGYPQWQELF